MFFSLISNKINTSDLKMAVENSRQTRPFEIVRSGSSSNLALQPGYKGDTILNNSYYFPNVLFDVYVALSPGDRILLYGQTDPIQNGIWTVMSVVSGYVNIQRPPDYAKNTPIRSGQCVLITEGATISGNIFRNTTQEYDSEQNKIISYNGTSPQYWQFYRTIYIINLSPTNQATFYEHCWYGGYYIKLGPGQYPNIQNIGSDPISSVKVPFGIQVDLYEQINFGGQMLTLLSDANCLDNPEFNFNDKTRSIIITQL